MRGSPRCTWAVRLGAIAPRTPWPRRSAPITAAAVLFKLKDILPHLREEFAVFAIGVCVSGAVGALAIGGLLSYIRRAGFGIFALYRIALAVLIVVVYLLR